MTVNYATVEETASDSYDFIPSAGKLSFRPGETSKTFTIHILQDKQLEAGETVRLVLSQPTGGASLSGPHTALLTIGNDDASASATNPIDEAQFFVRQHYLDFLNREPDPAGLDFWTNEITSCGTDEVCREIKRINVSTAFFLSIEYQNTGYLVYRFYKSSFTASAGRPKGLPRIDEVLADTQQIQRGLIVGRAGWEQQLEQNKQDFARLWVQRAEFLAQFPNDMPSGAFVDKLFANSGVTPAQAERDAAVAAFGVGGVEGRAAALRNVADSSSVYNKQYNSAFVLMQYFGYLRRNPDDPPDRGFGGYDFWLSKLDEFSLPGENVRDEAIALQRVHRAEMVKAFIVSGEYLSRFGTQAVTLAPAAAQTGKTVTVNINGQFTSFIKKITRARFGDGVSVGGAAAGDFGPVNVIDKTHATAEVTVAGSAAQGLRSVTIETVAERLVLDGSFAVSAISPLVISADVDRTTGVLSTPFTFTGRVVESTSPVEQWHWTLSDGRELMGMSISVSFPSPGLYGAHLMATDREGNVVHAETGVMVFDPATQAPPELGLPKQVGDIDGDGLITLKDAHRVSKHAGRLESLPDDAEPAADVDLDGRVTPDDARLLGQAVAAGAPLPRALLPARGAPGARINLISPALLDPTANIEIAVGESRWVQQPLRLIRGYATFIIPFDATRSGSMQVTPGPVEIRILSNGTVIDTLMFQVEAPLPLPANPKAELRKLLDDYVALLQINQDAIGQVLDQALVDGNERELLLATYTVAQEDVAAKLANMRALLDAPGGDELAQLFFIYANANGYPELRQRLAELSTNGVPALRAKLKAMAASAVAPSVDEILNVLCRAKDISDALSLGGDILSFGCDALLIAAVIAAVVPADGPLIDAALLFAWASACGTVEATLEMALLINELVGSLEADLRFEASPTNPQAGESVKLRATIELIGIDDVCGFAAGRGINELVEELSERAIERLLRKKLALRAISKAIELLSDDLLDELEDRLEEAVVRVVNRTSIGEALKELTDKICDLGNRGVPVVDDLSKIMQGPNPNVGTLTFASDGTADYTCSDQSSSSAESVTFTATRQMCDKTERKTATVTCRSRPVTITMGDNGNLNDDIFEVRIQGQTVLTSSSPVRSISTTVNLAAGDHTVEMIGRAAPDGVGTYFIRFSGATVIGGAPLSGSDLTPGVVKTFQIRVQ
jgi:hypothetical protein